jgi:hypothetical protein
MKIGLRHLGTAGLVVLAPMLMAPWGGPCHNCAPQRYNEKILAGESFAFEVVVAAGERADIIMRPRVGSPDLYCDDDAGVSTLQYDCRPQRLGLQEEVCSFQPAVDTRYHCFVRAGRNVAARFVAQVALSDGGCGVPGSEKHCTEGCTCGYQAGDCEVDTDCGTGLTCVDNVGARFGWGATVDVCL